MPRAKVNMLKRQSQASLFVVVCPPGRPLSSPQPSPGASLQKCEAAVFRRGNVPKYVKIAAGGVPMKILTSVEMKDIDRTAIEALGIPGIVLMENAGLRVARALKGRFPDIAAETTLVGAGKGTTGGDGSSAARHLFNSGARPEVLLLAAKDEVKGDAAVNLAVALKMGIPVTEVRTAAAWKKVRIAVFHASVIVDALFGTGLVKPLDEIFAMAVEDINKSSAFKLAVDIPSGLSADTFETIGPSVDADLTVTLAAPKIAHIFPPAAGSRGKAGAAALAGRAALRMGAGLVTVATAASALRSVARTMAELMTEPLAETPIKTIAAAALPRAAGLLQGKHALLPG